METEGSLRCSQDPATCPYSETDQSNQCPTPPIPRSSKWFHSHRFPHSRWNCVTKFDIGEFYQDLSTLSSPCQNPYKMNDILNEGLHTHLERNSSNTRSTSQISWHSVHEGGNVVSPTHRPHLPPPPLPPPRGDYWYLFLLEAGSTPGP